MFQQKIMVAGEVVELVKDDMLILGTYLLKRAHSGHLSARTCSRSEIAGTGTAPDSGE